MVEVMSRIESDVPHQSETINFLEDSSGSSEGNSEGLIEKVVTFVKEKSPLLETVQEDLARQRSPSHESTADVTDDEDELLEGETSSRLLRPNESISFSARSRHVEDFNWTPLGLLFLVVLLGSLFMIINHNVAPVSDEL